MLRDLELKIMTVEMMNEKGIIVLETKSKNLIHFVPLDLLFEMKSKEVIQFEALAL